MDKPIIEISNLGKKYRLGQFGAGSLREEIQQVTQKLRNRQLNRPNKSDFWALRNVSFNINQGDIVGIIGKNGAGKSTLLKLISRITEPTEGDIYLRGRVASLLEVGTGFHPELSGRENIYLNGTILGMRKQEIDRKLDEIIAFSGIEKHIDTPVKRYSSGMNVRLGFAIAAHLEPEILIVDEVLAVGDADFQKKCLGKMKDVAGQGRTVLFVSHNMGVVQTLCEKGFLLNRGELVFSSDIKSTVAHYLSQTKHHGEENELPDYSQRGGRGNARFSHIKIRDSKGNSHKVLAGESLEFEFGVTKKIPSLRCLWTIYNFMGIPIAHFNSQNTAEQDRIRSDGKLLFTCNLSDVLLQPGQYRINIALESGSDIEDHIENAAAFEVHENQVDGRAVHPNSNHGQTILKHAWQNPA